MNQVPSTIRRIHLLQTGIILICSIFVLRLFYLQVIRYSFYQEQADASQFKRYEIPAERGVIYALDGDEIVPLVLNERRYNIVSDPQVITDKESTALVLADILQKSKDDIMTQLTNDSRYEILAKKQPKEIRDKVEQAMADGEIQGTFAEKTNQRVYPQKTTAAQVLGFVDDDDNGRYGIEEALDERLGGEPGKVRSLTDQNGIPLLATGDNVVEDPVDGENIVLSINVAMQRQTEELLQKGLETARSESGSALILDPYSGKIHAMANFPSFDPAKFSEVSDPSLYTNAAVSSPLEPGSIMKTLTTAAALDTNSVSPNTTYFDPGGFTIDGATVKNVGGLNAPATRSISDILRLSLNTGATYLLMQMGGGEINEEARVRWHDYMVNHYQLGKITGIEQGYEEPGFIPDPLEGFGRDIRYANTSFGQGMSATTLQMAAALSSAINGGTYYKPTLVAGTLSDDEHFTPTKPVVVKEQVVKTDVSATLRDFMVNVINNNLREAAREGYRVGGKTGTAEIARPEGGYYEDRFNGTYMGFVGGELPEYVLIVRVNEPKIPGYAGSAAAGPIFSSITNMLIDNFSVRSE